MKKRDVLLDFTSLLDVTLIIIFFFVIFSHFENEQNQALVDEKVKEMNESIEEANEAVEEANKKSEQLEKEIEIVREESERRAENIKEIANYNNSGNIKILLDMISNKEWKIRILHSDELIEEVYYSEDLEGGIVDAFEKSGYDENMTIFCEFVYSGNIAGTRKSYERVILAFENVQKQYKYIYVSKTNLSTGE